LDFKPAQTGPVTHLLHDRQVHAELHQTYHHIALRLNSMQAILSESPWRLDFDPRSQLITLHCIRLWREGAARGQADLASARVFDRGTSGANPAKPLTLVVMLEDLRPGDVLECAYTIETRSLLLPENCTALFALPEAAAIGRFSFSVIFNPARRMQWKASQPEWQPVQKQIAAGNHWSWTQENFAGFQTENNTPPWFVSWPWIQISDCASWNDVSAAFAAAWAGGPLDPAVQILAEEMTAGSAEPAVRAEKAAQLLQQEFRCLPVEGEWDGHPPTAPATVARRRYGDARDLAYLLVEVLRALGLEARPVLVNTVFRQSLNELLPSPEVFNHVLVEYQVGPETRWVDATRPSQARENYGFALPVAAPGAELSRPPARAMAGDLYDLKESILIDTAGGWSWLSVTVTARGGPAEALRSELEREGVEAMARRRLRECTARFNTARRDGTLQFRDNPEGNEFILSEIFEIKDFLTTADTKWRKLELRNEELAHYLPTPDVGPRRAPFALPHPCQVVHTVELHSIALAPALVQQRRVKTNYFDVQRVRKTMAGFWTMKLSLATLTDAVPPAALEEYRSALQEIGQQSLWSILLPAGDARPHRRDDFGKLPEIVPAAPPPATVPLPPSRPVPDPADPIPYQSQHTATRKKRRRQVERKPKSRWVVVAGCGLGLVLILIVIVMARYADRWKLFRQHPGAPAQELNTMPER
jgi:hypothetical protein